MGGSPKEGVHFPEPLELPLGVAEIVGNIVSRCQLLGGVNGEAMVADQGLAAAVRSSAHEFDAVDEARPDVRTA